MPPGFMFASRRRDQSSDDETEETKTTEKPSKVPEKISKSIKMMSYRELRSMNSSDGTTKKMIEQSNS